MKSAHRFFALYNDILSHVAFIFLDAYILDRTAFAHDQYCFFLFDIFLFYFVGQRVTALKKKFVRLSVSAWFNFALEQEVLESGAQLK